MKARKVKPPKESPPRERQAAVRVPVRPVRRSERSDGGDAFIPDPGEGPARTDDDLAEVLAEDFVEAATRGNDVFEDELDRPLSDEMGGPFIVTDPRDELAEGSDESNPPDAEMEPLPRANAGLIQRPRQDEFHDALRAEDIGDDLEAQEDTDADADADVEIDESDESIRRHPPQRTR